MPSLHNYDSLMTQFKSDLKKHGLSAIEKAL
jgi:hypothetical protein